MLYVYTISQQQKSGLYEVEVILSSRVVNCALEADTPFKRAMRVVRKLARRASPAFREPHSVQQHIANQFNMAVKEHSPIYKEYLAELERVKTVAASNKRHRGPVELPEGFTDVMQHQIKQLHIERGRRATLQERIWFLVIGLANIEAPLTPKAVKAEDTEQVEELAA